MTGVKAGELLIGDMLKRGRSRGCEELAKRDSMDLRRASRCEMSDETGSAMLYERLTLFLDSIVQHDHDLFDRVGHAYRNPMVVQQDILAVHYVAFGKLVVYELDRFDIGKSVGVEGYT